MTTATHVLSGHPSLSLRQRVGDFAKREWATLWTRRAKRATARILRDLDDTTLRDIGLSRSEIDSLVYGDHSDRKLRYDGR